MPDVRNFRLDIQFEEWIGNQWIVVQRQIRTFKESLDETTYKYNRLRDVMNDS